MAKTKATVEQCNPHVVVDFNGRRGAAKRRQYCRMYACMHACKHSRPLKAAAAWLASGMAGFNMSGPSRHRYGVYDASYDPGHVSAPGGRACVHACTRTLERYAWLRKVAVVKWRHLGYQRRPFCALSLVSSNGREVEVGQGPRRGRRIAGAMQTKKGRVAQCGKVVLNAVREQH